MLKSFFFYTVAGTLFALIAQAAGAGIMIVLLSSLLGPPVFLLAVAILHHNGYV